jgi:hypothetical protein
MLELWDGDYDEWKVYQLFISMHKANNKLVNAYLEHFWCTASYGHTHIHNIHHSLDLEETTTFPFIVLFVACNGGYTHKWCFSQDSQIGSPIILEIGTFTILDTHNLLCKPLIEVMFETKLFAFIENFQKICGMPLAHM